MFFCSMIHKRIIPYIALLFPSMTMNLYPAFIEQDTYGYRGAFVIPFVIKEGKKYVLLGRESAGKDKGLYCVPGGSSGFWIFRDTNPLDTAAREFCEETLTTVTYKAVRDMIAGPESLKAVIQSQGKKIVAYSVSFSEALIDDIVYNFAARRKATWFWQYYYREMDHYALVEWDSVVMALNTADDEGKHCIVQALVFNAKTAAYAKRSIMLRPIAVLLLRKV